MDFNQVLNVCKIILMIVGTISGSLGLIITVLYLPSFLQKKVKLKEAEDIAKENLEIVEKAIFFETSEQFNTLIEQQIEKIRANEAKLKALYAESSQIEKDNLNSKGKK